MGQMYGASPDQLDGLGSHMTHAADRLDTIRSEVAALLRHSHWEGGDADYFRGQWNYRLSAQLLSVAILAREGAITVRANAQQQRDASGVGGSYGGYRLGTPGSSTRGNVNNGFSFDDLVSLGLYGLSAFGYIGDIADGLRPFYKDFPAARKIVDAVDGLVEGNLGTKLLGKALGVFDIPLQVFGIYWDYQHGVNAPPDSAEAFNSRVDVAFGVTELALTIALFTPIGPAAGLVLLGVGGIHVLYDTFVSNQEIYSDIVESVGEVAGEVWDGVVDGYHVASDAVGAAADAVESAIGTAEDAARDVISGGVNAVKGLLRV